MKTIKVFLVSLLFFPILSYAEEIPLTIHEVIHSSLKHNLDIKIEEYTPKQFEEVLEEKKAPFDPNFIFITGITDSNTSSASSTADTVTHSGGINGSAEVTKKFEYGTEAALKYTATSATSNSSYTGLRPQHDAEVSLIVLQPLLRNRGVDVNTSAIQVSENNVEIEKLNFRQQLIDVVSESQQRYWDLYSSRDQLMVKLKSLKLAEKFLEESKLKAKVGAIAPLDVLQARSEVAYREEDIIIAENTMKNNEDNLLNYIFGDSNIRGNVLLKEKPLFLKEEVDETSLINTAFKNRTEYLVAKYNIESADINIVFAKNQKLATVDLQGTLKSNGLSGTRANGSTTDFVGSFSKANERMLSSKYYYAGLSLKVEFPWGIRRDRARYRSALYEKEKALIRFTKAEQQIILDVRTAVRNVRAQSKRYHAAEVAADLAEQTLEAEQKKYKVGISTSYDVLQVQRDYTDASVKHIQAIIDYQLARVNLHKMTGTTLDKNNIQVAGSAIEEKKE